MTALEHDAYVACAFCDASHRGDLLPARWRVTRDSRIACPLCAAKRPKKELLPQVPTAAPSSAPADRARPPGSPEPTPAPVPSLERGEWIP